MDIYRAGYISATQGSAIIEGFGTRWLNYVHSGDQLTIGGVTYDIQSVDDNHLLTLNTVFTGDSVERGKYEISLTPVVKSLEQIKSEVASAVDVLAGQTRLKYITDAPGQSESYTAKLKSAEAYIAAGYPSNATPYKWVKKEADKTGASPTQIADLIVYTAGLWEEVGSEIESERQAAKLTISSATSEAGIYAAEQVFKTAMALL